MLTSEILTCPLLIALLWSCQSLCDPSAGRGGRRWTPSESLPEDSTMWFHHPERPRPTPDRPVGTSLPDLSRRKKPDAYMQEVFSYKLQQFFTSDPPSVCLLLAPVYLFVSLWQERQWHSKENLAAWKPLVFDGSFSVELLKVLLIT